MSVWGAIALAVTGSACMNLGLVLQKRGIVPPKPQSSEIGATFRRSRHTPIWYVGLLLMVGGCGRSSVMLANAAATRAEVLKHLPLGTPIEQAKSYMEGEGFHCVPMRNQRYRWG